MLLKKEDSLLICRVVESPYPSILFSLVIKPLCAVQVFIGNVEVHKLGQFKIPSTINDTNILDELLQNLRQFDSESYSPNSFSVTTVIQLVLSLLTLIKDESFQHLASLKFVCEQLYLMTLNKLNYSAEFLIFASLLYHCSPQGYRLLREKKFLIMPGYCTIRRISGSNACSPGAEQQDSNFLLYIKNKFKALDPNDTTVILMVDEIHIKPNFDYKGGNIVGAAFNSSAAASSAFVFMVSSIKSKFKDVVHILPTVTMKAELLYNLLKRVILGLEDIGFSVICVVTDNNAINGKALSYFAKPPKLSIVYPHPAQCNRPLFFMFDSVHILKCIRNNWIGQKDIDKTMRFPQFSSNGEYNGSTSIMHAPFRTIERLYHSEADLLLKHSYKLSIKAISPTTFEKQNVNLVLQIFNEYLIQALLTVGKKLSLTSYTDVAEYIKIFLTWWTIMNVKTPLKGIRLNNTYAAPLTNDEHDTNFLYLNKFSDWLEMWQSIKDGGGMLSRETYTALKHTTHAMIEMTNYCISELNMNYILPGKFQTDNLEARFGKYRLLAGSNYHISLRQVFECEKKLRIMSVLRLTLPINEKVVPLKLFGETNWEGMENHSLRDLHKLNVEVVKNDFDNCEDVLPIIVYVAGYCCYTVCKKMNCNYCKDLISCNRDTYNHLPESHNYIKGISRGSLLHPNPSTVNMVTYNYIIINKLIKEDVYKHSNQQRTLATDVTLSALADDECLLPIDFCEDGHNSLKLGRMIIWASTNILLNNYCSKENNMLAQARATGKSRKRKLETVSK